MTGSQGLLSGTERTPRFPWEVGNREESLEEGVLPRQGESVPLHHVAGGVKGHRKILVGP